MSTRSHGRTRTVLLALLSATGVIALACAPPASAQQPAPSKEMRAQMATIHEQMAACLRSDKPIADCHAEMVQSCQKVGCPMGAMGMGPGPKGSHGGMMQSQPQSPPAKQ